MYNFSSFVLKTETKTQMLSCKHQKGVLFLNSLTIMQRCDRCEQWNTFRNCNDEIVDFRHRLFLYFAAYLIYLGTTFRDNMTGNNCTFSKQTFLWRHFEDFMRKFSKIITYLRVKPLFQMCLRYIRFSQSSTTFTNLETERWLIIGNSYHQ